MVILPKILYLFQTIPIFLPKSFFKNLDKFISTFIWNKTIPRVRKAVLERHKSKGGLGLPNFLHYYWAANVFKLTIWYNTCVQGTGPSWSLMEQQSCPSTSLSSLLCSPLPITFGVYTENPIVKASIQIWSQFRKHFGNKLGLISMPLAQNFLFKPSMIDTVFLMWARKGIKNVGDLFFDGSFATFEQLSTKFDLPKSHFFRYLQARDFVRSIFPSFPLKPDECPFDDCLTIRVQGLGGISELYSTIQNIKCSSLLPLKGQWEDDLNFIISDENWQKAITKIYASSICVRHRLIQFKIFNRLHLSRTKLAKIYPNVDPNCIRCRQAPATLAHMFWSCPNLNMFWSDIFKTFTYICKKPIIPDPLTAVFGVVHFNVGVSKGQSQLIAFSTLLARRLILTNWKSPSPPTHSRWVSDVMSFLQLEKIRTIVHNSADKFQDIWQPFLDYYDTEFDANSLDQ